MNELLIFNIALGLLNVYFFYRISSKFKIKNNGTTFELIGFELDMKSGQFVITAKINGTFTKIPVVVSPGSKRKPQAKKKSLPSAKNSHGATVGNSVVEHQAFKTAVIEVPVIAEDVLEYGPGEISTFPNGVKLFYPKDAITDPDYWETIMRSPYSKGTHEENTTEEDLNPAGAIQGVWWDERAKKVMSKGVLFGKDTVDYVKGNQLSPGFGSSAYIRFIKIDRTPGVAPNGKPYDAIATKLVNNHVAILPNIRDKNNVIVAVNALKEDDIDQADDDTKAKNEISKNEDTEMPEAKMTDEELDAYMERRNAKNKAEEEMRNSIKNEIMEELGLKKETENGGKNEDKADDKKETKSEEKAENTDDEKEDKEDAEAANAIEPSDEMLKDFSTHLGMNFKVKPSLKVLGKALGIEAKNTAELITAVNAKRKEVVSGSSESGSAEGKNSEEVKSLDDFLKTI